MKESFGPYTLSSSSRAIFFGFFCSIFDLIEEHGGNPILTALINELKKVYRGSQ